MGRIEESGKAMAWTKGFLGLGIICGLAFACEGERTFSKTKVDFRTWNTYDTVPENRTNIGYGSSGGVNSAKYEIGQWKNLRGDRNSFFRRSKDPIKGRDAVNRTCGYKWYCPHYCIKGFRPAVSLPNEKFKWVYTRSYCPSQIEPECAQLDPLGLIGIGDNSYCFISFHEISTRNVLYEFYSEKMIAIFYHGTGRKEVAARRKCGTKRNCFFGYCLKRRGGETTCGNTVNSYQLDDPHPDCLWKTADNSSLRISEDEWCCRTPDGCGTPVGKCSQSEDCYANYCIGVPGANQTETRCPEEKNETEWEECGNLKWRQTKWIPGRNAWCCIPEKNNGCDYKVRSCGLDLSCRSEYCIREREGDSFRTYCPKNRIDRRCESLQEGQELILSSKHMCCRTNECLANGTICGDNPICEKDYCVAWKTDGSSELTTACPTVEEDRLLNRKCMVIPIGSTLMVKKNKVWCCKRRHCRIEDPDPNRADHSSLLKIVLAVLIMANVVTCGSCCVGIVCYRLVIFERKRGRNLRRTQVRVRSSQKSPFENRVDALLEKILHGEEASGVDPTEVSTSVTEVTNPAEETNVGSPVNEMKSVNPREAAEGSKNGTEESIATQKVEEISVTKKIVFENESEDSKNQEKPLD